MADLAEEKFGKVPSGDSKPNSWTLLDFGKYSLASRFVFLHSDGVPIPA